jgi:alpha-D-ribose 1-methylphosphonate 5-triphosphate synthase subunit PhnG
MTDTQQNNSREHFSPVHLRQKRQEIMAVLASSSADEIDRHMRTIEPIPAHEDVRTAASGLVMLRGRIGGDGAPFNFGEATVTRAAVRLETKEVGFGYVLGRDRAKARLVALCDALIQHDEYRDRVEHHVVAPIRERLHAERRLKAEQVAATKVDFFTLVRGED